MEKNERSPEEETSNPPEFIIETKGFKMKMKAKKDHLVVQNKFRFDIKKGDDLSEIPEHFYEALKAEQVI